MNSGPEKRSRTLRGTAHVLLHQVQLLPLITLYRSLCIYSVIPLHYSYFTCCRFSLYLLFIMLCITVSWGFFFLIFQKRSQQCFTLCSDLPSHLTKISMQTQLFKINQKLKLFLFLSFFFLSSFLSFFFFLLSFFFLSFLSFLFFLSFFLSFFSFFFLSFFLFLFFPSFFLSFSFFFVWTTYLKGSYDAISSCPFSLECYKLFVHR